VAFQIVTAAQPVAIRRPKGSTITFVNQNAGGGTDVYLSADRGQLSSSVLGAAPAGIRLAAGGTTLQYPNFPGVLWARAIADTAGLEVLP
jgi:hypothetical protein